MRQGVILSVLIALSVVSQASSGQLSRQEVEQIVFDFRAGVDWRLKEANVGRLARTGETCVPLLIECLKSELPAWLQARIAESARQEPPLAGRADGSTVGVQGWAETSLVRIGEPAVPLLIESLDNQPDTVGRVARILGSIGDRRAIPSLVGILRDRSQSVGKRHCAAQALQVLDAWAAVAPLIDVLAESSDESRMTEEFHNVAATALAELTGRSFGFTFALQLADKAGGVAPRYIVAGSPEDKERTATRWKRWLSEQESLRSHVEATLQRYAERLKNDGRQGIKAMRTDDYVRRVIGSNGRLVLMDSLEGEWFDVTEPQADSSLESIDYEFSLLGTRDEGHRIVVTTRDKVVLIRYGSYRSLVARVERVLVEEGDVLLVNEENVLEWEQPRYSDGP